MPEQEIAYGIGTIDRNEFFGIYDVSERLAHLLPTRGDESMHKKRFREWQTSRKKHGRPYCRMETQDVFPDNVHVGRPKFTVQRVITTESKRRYVIGKRIAPHIHNL